MEPLEFYKFSLFVENTIHNRDEAFRVTATKNQTLLEAMQAFNYYKFCFQTKTAPDGETYVVDVNGVKAEDKRFWETLLYDAEKKEVCPISFAQMTTCT
ncbi:unnamed protein product [Tetraodon nigroviridis]|uniref:(spotted green pufferfish) hypothetical protein n=1 Tax=Tetraodon nigroviridis TaxID=99883 RepID=Q4RYP4_TETNG|nr:unnamed protein product [Tetraodon nigroviridis]